MQPVPMFSAPVAEAAQDLFDQKRSSSALVSVVAHGNVGRRRAAKAIYEWSAAMEECRAKLTGLSEALTNVSDEQDSATAAIRLRLLDAEESISLLLDQHFAAVWMSIPFEARVLRIRALLIQLDGLLLKIESAKTCVDHQAAVDGWMRVHDLIDEKVSLDPAAATSAGFDIFRHDAFPLPWGEDSSHGVNSGV